MLLVIASCKTREERANRLIERANRLYPIKEMVSEKIVIDTVIKWDTVYVIKVDTVTVSIPVYDKDTKELIVYKNKVIFEDSRFKIIANSNLKTNNLDFKVERKEIKETISGEVRVRIDTLIKKELIRTAPTIVKVKGFFWWAGFVSVLLVTGAAIILSIRTIKRYKPF